MAAGALLAGLPATGGAREIVRELVTPDGLRVWLMPQEGAATVALVAHVPAGGASDPAGREGLAHFVEHMLFTDDDGRDELAFLKEVGDHGGHVEARTTRSHTFVRIEAPAEHAALALQWARRLLLDHTFHAAAADEERAIVLLESNLGPPEPLDHLRHLVERLDVLDPPSFWEEEFGLEEDDRSVGGTWASIQRVTAGDLQAFYDRHYRLEDMTLFLAGGFDARAVAEDIRRHLTPSRRPRRHERPPPPGPPVPVDRGRYRQEVRFSPGGSRTYARVFKVHGAGQADIVTLFFLRDFLREYLNDELRFRERSTYGVTTSVGILRTAAYLEISGEFAGDRWDDARQRIDRIVDDLRRERIDEARFAEYRDRATVDLALTAKTPELLARNFTRHYHDRDVFTTYPDVEGYYESVSRAEVGAFARRWLVPEHEVRRLTLAAPLSRSAELGVTATVALLVWLALRRRWAARPLDLRRLRYLRKLRSGVAERLLVLVLAAAAYALWQQGLVVAGQRVDRLFWGVESYWVRLALDHARVAAWVYLSVLPFTFWPRRVLVLSDGLLVKCWAFRSWWIPFAAVERVETCRWPGLRHGLTWPLTLGLFATGVRIGRRGRPGLFLQTRNVPELAETLARLHAAHAGAPAPA